MEVTDVEVTDMEAADMNEGATKLLTGLKTVTVGIDGSDGSCDALRWATQATDADIQPATAWRMPWWAATPPVPGNPMPPQRDFFEDKAREVIEQATARIERRRLRSAIIACGHAGRVLSDVAGRTDMLVVGSRGRSAMTEAVLGSTNSYCAAHSPVPVLIVPTGEPGANKPEKAGDAVVEVSPARGAHFVVGVDGSDNSVAALAWTIEHAAAGSTIEAIHAFTPVGATYELAGFDADRLEERARSLLATTVDRAVNRVDRPGEDYELTMTVSMADPRNALARAGGDIVVVGARGHRGVAHLVLGSVATALTHRTATPTVIVPVD